MLTRAYKRAKLASIHSSTMLSVLCVIFPLLTVQGLSSLACCCREFYEKCFSTLVPQMLWPLSFVKKLGNGKSCVRRVRVDKALKIPSGVMEVVDCVLISKLGLKSLSNLTSLEFDNSFNKKISVGVLPPSLTRLKFGAAFNQPLVTGSLPASIVELCLGEYYYQAMALPTNLLRLHLRNFNMIYYSLISKLLPSTLRELNCLLSVYQGTFTFPSPFPDSLTHFRSQNFWLFPTSWPAGLIHIELDSAQDFRIQPGGLPPNLTYLRVGHRYNELFEPGVLPPTLDELVLGTAYSQRLTKKMLPASLKRLVYPRSQDRRLKLLPRCWMEQAGSKLFFK